MVQIVVPSREDIPEYAQLRRRIERLVSNINGEYSKPGWVPIHYFHRSVPRAELIAFYRAAHIALITPLKDGMNLVAKEFCASRVDNLGVLVLSEFAGAAAELRNGALLVNPHDTDSVASAVGVALRMSEPEQRLRMETMRTQVKSYDVFRWSESCFRMGTMGATGIEPMTSTVSRDEGSSILLIRLRSSCSILVHFRRSSSLIVPKLFPSFPSATSESQPA